MGAPAGGHAIGVDLGGTFIKAGVVDRQGRLLYHHERPTGADGGRDAIIANILAAAEEVRRGAGLEWDGVRALGLGSPGVFDSAHGGLVHNAPNLPSLEGQPLLELLQERLDRPEVCVCLENDANAAAYGEMWAGAGREVNTLVLFTLGTGIGGGIVLDGKVWRGATGFAAELGHQTILPDGPRCGCGNHGCLEVLASAPALVRRLREAVAAGRPTGLAPRLSAGEAVSAKDVHTAAVQGDETARALIEETGRYLGIAAANMINILNPDMIAFGGGMIGAGAMLLDPIRGEARRRAIPVSYNHCRIVYAVLGNNAGLIGAAGCAWQASETSAS